MPKFTSNTCLLYTSPTYSSGILAELGSIQAFPSNNAVAKYAGIVWKENHSGCFKAENKMCIRDRQ